MGVYVQKAEEKLEGVPLYVRLETGELGSRPTFCVSAAKASALYSVLLLCLRTRKYSKPCCPAKMKDQQELI